jgi:lysophospholipase L1-like esterase
MIMMLGDSITAGFDVDRFFHGSSVVNKGVSGDNTDSVLARLNRDVVDIRPDFLFILIGTNDMASLFPDEKIIANYEKILKILNENLPRTKSTVQSILPTRGLENRPISRIRLLNSMIESAAKKINCAYLDLAPFFSGPDECIPADLSEDGLHLTEAGYTLWAVHLRKAFAACVSPQ